MGTNAIANTAATITRSLAILIVVPPARHGSPVALRCAIPLSLSLTTDATRELSRDHDAPADGLERQHGQAPRRWTIDDACAVRRIESRRVTRAEQALRCRMPHRDGTPLMCAYGGVGDHALRGVGARGLGELRRSEPDQRDLVEQGTVADDLGGRVHREGQLLGTAERKVVWYDHLASSLAEREDEAIALVRPSCLVVLSR